MNTTRPDPSHFTRAVTDFGSAHNVVTTQAIYNVHGAKVIEQGVAIRPNLYERLMQHQLSAPLEESVTSLPSITPSVLQEKAAQALERTPLYERMVSDPQSRSLLLESMARIALPAPIAFQLTLACEMRPQLFSHLVDSAVVAAWLAMDPHHPSHLRVVQAATTGLLHDIGMLHLNPVLLDYRQTIDEALQRELYTHPMVAHLLTSQQNAYAKEVLEGILDHHEFMDGSGYPRAISGASLGSMARILGLTELVVGAYAPGRLVSELRLSIVLRMNLHRYDEALAHRLLALLQPYPEVIGSELTLLANPAAQLREVHTALQKWPQSLPTTATERQLTDGVFITQRVQQLQHNLARVGAAPEHLDQWDADKADPMLQHEFTLLAEEAAWQLRALARQTRQRWYDRGGHGVPEAVTHWLELVDRTLARLHTDTGAMLANDSVH